jgi:hypothetical protein
VAIAIRHKILVGTAVVALIAWLVINWHWLIVSFVILTAEGRPALLRDAEWDEPASAVQFMNRFPPRSSETELLEWLESNDFEIYVARGQAYKSVLSGPCGENIDVEWTRQSSGVIESAQVEVREAGCL